MRALRDNKYAVPDGTSVNICSVYLIFVGMETPPGGRFLKVTPATTEQYVMLPHAVHIPSSILASSANPRMAVWKTT